MTTSRPTPLSSSSEDPAAAFSRAVDQLADAGFDCAICDTSDPAAKRLAELLKLLEIQAQRPIQHNESADESLTEATMARIGVAHPALTPASAAAVDEVVEGGWQSANGNLNWLGQLLEAQPAESRGTRFVRIERAMRLAQQAAADRQDRLSFEQAVAAEQTKRRIRLSSMRLSDVGAMAAMLLLGVAVMWPMLVAMRAGFREVACQSHLQAAGAGFSLFAADHDGRLPQASQRKTGDGAGVWWNVGQAPSHSANLFVLISDGYTKVGSLSCPGNPAAPEQLSAEQLSTMHDWCDHAAVSYSLQLYGAQAPRLGYRPNMVLLVDKSPIVTGSMAGKAVYAMLQSHNHRGRGQNALRHDGSVDFLTSPLLEGGDNIWLPASVEGLREVRLHGTELPADSDDAFVGP